MTSDEVGGRRRPAMSPRGRAALVLGILVVVGLVIWGLVSASGATQPTPGSSASPAATEGADPSASASDAPVPSASSTPSATAGSGPSGSAPPAAPPGADPPLETLPPVPLDEPAQPTDVVTVELASIEEVVGEANIAGEVGGPALRVTVEASNAGDAPFDTATVVVNLYIGEDRRPANEIREPGGRAFPASIPADGSSTGVYLFTVPEDERELILVEVSLQVEEPVVLFEGAVR